MVSQILRTRAEKPAPSERSALIIEVGDTWRIWGGKEDRREEWVGSTTQALNQLNHENKSVALNADERLVGTEGVSAAQQQLRRGLCPRQERRLSRRRKTLQTRDANPTLSPTFLLHRPSAAPSEPPEVRTCRYGCFLPLEIVTSWHVGMRIFLTGSSIRS